VIIAALHWTRTKREGIAMLKAERTKRSISAVAIAIWFSVQLSFAHVHHDPDGRTIAWYPKDCCGDGDCKPVTEVERVGAGVWLKTADGIAMFVGSQEPRQHSHDLSWHVCVRFDHDAQTLVLHCVFEPRGAVFWSLKNQI
jgi:hypothetical protein